MQKPSPITKEYVDYLESLPDDVLVEKCKDFTPREKAEARSLSAGGIIEYNGVHVGDEVEYTMGQLDLTGTIKFIEISGVANIVRSSYKYGNLPDIVNLNDVKAKAKD